MRLIDADELVKFLKGCTMSNGTLINTNTMLAVVEKMPTACDVEKLSDKIRNYFKDKIEKGKEVDGWDIVNFNADIQDIVKRGGIDVENIRQIK